MSKIHCIGLIMDGNRRWAKKEGLSMIEGHRRGYVKFNEVMEWIMNAGITHTIVYAFSTENWNRSEKEVAYLLNLFRTAFKNEFSELKEKGVRVKFLGEREKFSNDIQKMIRDIEKESKDNTKYTLGVALSYGGRREIVNAVNRAIKEGKKITEESFKRLLYTSDIPDPDLIIRTSGEMRLSNFLPWQSVYSELFFTDTYWPDFSKDEFDKILVSYETRQRRKGT